MERDEKGHFLPGISGNPGGRKPLPEDLKEMQYQEKVWAARKMHEFKHMTVLELQAKQIDPMASAQEMVLISTYILAINGNVSAQRIIYDHTLPPVVKTLELSGPNGTPIEQRMNHFSIMGVLKDEAASKAVDVLHERMKANELPANH